MDIENLQINIEASASDAAGKLLDLETILKRIDALGKSGGFDALYRKLKKLASLDFSGTNAGLNGLAGAANRVAGSASKIEKYTKTVKKMKTAAETATAEIRKMNAMILYQRQMPTVFGAYYPRQHFADQLSSPYIDGYLAAGNMYPQAVRTSGGRRSVYSEVRDHIDGYLGGGREIPRLAPLHPDVYQESAEKGWAQNNYYAPEGSWTEKETVSRMRSFREYADEIKSFGGVLGRSGDDAKGAAKQYGYFHKAIMRFTAYRALRMLINGISEGMQNIARYSKEANAVLTEYKTTGLMIKNTLGATIVPILQAALPLVQTLSDAFIGLANSINIVVSAINGSKTFTVAKKYVDDYAKSLQKTKNLLGIDEIHTLGQQYDYSKMFETKELTGWDIVGAIANITLLTTGVLALKTAFTGGAWLTTTATGFKNIWKTIKGLITGTASIPTLVKWLGGAAGFVGGFVLAEKAGESFAEAMGNNGKGSVGGSLIELVGGVGMGVIGGGMIGGPIGAVIGGLVALGAAFIGAAKKGVELRKEALLAEAFKVEGRALAEVRSEIEKYLQALDIDRAGEWNSRVETATQDFRNAKAAYEELWTYLDTKEAFNSEDIENLATAFSDLAEASKALREASIGSLMQQIASGIKKNITSDLSDTLGDLLEKVAAAKDIIGGKASDLQKRYQSIVDSISENGGVATAEQRSEMAQITRDLYTLTPSNLDKEYWQGAVMDASRINAGSSLEEIKSNLDQFAASRDDYLSKLREQYENNRATMLWMRAADKEYGLGLWEDDSKFQADIDALESVYKDQIDTVTGEFDRVVRNIAYTYQESMLEQIKGIDIEDTSWWALLVPGGMFEFLRSGISHAMDVSTHDALVDAMNETMDEILEYLVDKTVSHGGSYATGGFPEDGLFMANHGELVGKFSNGKTAVANNEQIVEGIKQGVIEALNESGGVGGGDWTIQIIDEDGDVKSETVISAMQRKNRRDGKTVIPLGV